ncbi:hypothetical protein [Marivita sp.]|uniref:hypothetical protein n=1 Tax=Marivita sp. TaxID=2003365 RepID=UPI003B5B3BE5
MTLILTSLLSSLGRRFAYWVAIVGAMGFAIWILIRQGKHAAEADLAIRRADARVRALQTSKDIRHDVQNANRADLERRADRWMRD